MIKPFVAIIIVGSPDVLKWLSYARFTNLKARNRGKKLQISAINIVEARKCLRSDSERLRTVKDHRRHKRVNIAL